tara:strand:- start:2111 stop:2305 length:195 start_codon:yes stop_codon:yes gene_type:complete
MTVVVKMARDGFNTKLLVPVEDQVITQANLEEQAVGVKLLNPTKVGATLVIVVVPRSLVMEAHI